MRTVMAAVLMVAATSAAAQMYRWTDQSGRVHFTDTPPPGSARNVQKRAAGAGGADPSAGSNEPYALQMARKNNPVKLYSAPGCGAACDEARKLLNARGVPFAEVSVASEARINELKELVGSPSVPALVVGGNVRKGFEEGAYHAALDAGGYPKTGILRPRNQAEPQQQQPAEGDAQAQGDEPAEETPVRRGPYSPR